MISRHHLTRNAIEARYYCRKCNKQTMHRIDSGRKGPCLECLARQPKRSLKNIYQEVLF